MENFIHSLVSDISKTQRSETKESNQGFGDLEALKLQLSKWSCMLSLQAKGQAKANFPVWQSSEILLAVWAKGHSLPLLPPVPKCVSLTVYGEEEPAALSRAVLFSCGSVGPPAVAAGVLFLFFFSTRFSPMEKRTLFCLFSGASKIPVMWCDFFVSVFLLYGKCH